MITDYSTLVSEIGDWLHRGDMTTPAKTAIQFFESRWNRTMRAVDMQVRQTTEVSGEYLTLPTGLLGFRNLQLNTTPVRKLDIVPPTFIDQRYSSSSTGKPVVAAIVGGELQLAPIPDTTYTIEMAFYKSLTALSDSNTSNWLLAKFPDLYFWGSLWAALGYTMNDQRAAMVKNAYDMMMEEFREYDEARQWGLGALQARAG